MNKLTETILTALASICIIGFFIVSCDPPKERLSTYTSTDKISQGDGTFNSTGQNDYFYKGMHYKVFQNTNGGISTVNVTKDSLEVLKLKEEVRMYYQEQY